MLFHYDYSGQTLIYVPDEMSWELTVSMNENMQCVMRLNYGMRTAVLVDTGCWKRGRPLLPGKEITELLNAVASAISLHLSLHPETHYIDINEFETKLVTELFYPRWKKMGYITPDFDGNW